MHKQKSIALARRATLDVKHLEFHLQNLFGKHLLGVLGIHIGEKNDLRRIEPLPLIPIGTVRVLKSMFFQGWEMYRLAGMKFMRLNSARFVT